MPRWTRLCRYKPCDRFRVLCTLPDRGPIEDRIAAWRETTHDADRRRSSGNIAIIGSPTLDGNRWGLLVETCCRASLVPFCATRTSVFQCTIPNRPSFIRLDSRHALAHSCTRYLDPVLKPAMIMACLFFRLCGIPISRGTTELVALFFFRQANEHCPADSMVVRYHSMDWKHSSTTHLFASCCSRARRAGLTGIGRVPRTTKHPSSNVPARSTVPSFIAPAIAVRQSEYA